MQLKTALIFGSNMVLQRNKSLPVWGIGIPNQKVEIRIQGKQAETYVNEDGQWKITLGALDVSENESMEIFSGGEIIRYTNISIGDVWIAAGQSNMEFGMYSDKEYEEVKKKCENTEIRFYDVPKVAYEGQNLPHNSEGFWRICNEENLRYYSAVGYYFANKVQSVEHIPIGIIGCNWGGSTACCWVDGSYCKENAAKIWWDEYETALRSLDMKKYEEAMKTDFSSIHNDWIDTPYAEYMCIDATLEGLQAAMTMDMPVLTGPKSPNRPSGLYETMLKKIVPFGMTGVIWYQGESDDVKAEVYDVLMESLITNWRELWNEEFPFLFVQIAPYEGYGRLSGINYPVIRRQQQKNADKVSNTAMAVITDVGARYDIHPKKKRAVGERLALHALRKVYGRALLCESPMLVAGRWENGELVLIFRNAGEGLKLHGKQINALEVIQDGRETEKYEYVIEENQIRIQSKEINPQQSIQVKFACQPYYEVNLYSSAGLPVRPSEIIVQ